MNETPQLKTNLPRVARIRGFENRCAPIGAKLALGEKLATAEVVCRKVNGVELRIGSLNVGSMNGRGEEVSDMLGRRKIDVCCLQETRWKE